MMSFFVTKFYVHGDRLSYTLVIRRMFQRLGFVLECMNVDLGYWTQVYHAFKCKHDGRKKNLEYQQTYPLSASFSLYTVSSNVCQQVKTDGKCAALGT